jgi:hypothetical protein
MRLSHQERQIDIAQSNLAGASINGRLATVSFPEIAQVGQVVSHARDKFVERKPLVLLANTLNRVIGSAVPTAMFIELSEEIRCPPEIVGSLANPSAAPSDVEGGGLILTPIRKQLVTNKRFGSDPELFPLVRG